LVGCRCAERLVAQPRAALTIVTHQLVSSAPIVGCSGVILIEAPS
jgi:hypothetical protein